MLGPQWSVDNEGNSSAKAQDGELTLEAHVILGGNGRWTRYVILSRIGRPKKRGYGRIASQMLIHLMEPQMRTRDEAIKWAELTWERMVNELPSVGRARNQGAAPLSENSASASPSLVKDKKKILGEPGATNTKTRT